MRFWGVLIIILHLLVFSSVQGAPRTKNKSKKKQSCRAALSGKSTHNPVAELLSSLDANNIGEQSKESASSTAKRSLNVRRASRGPQSFSAAALSVEKSLDPQEYFEQIATSIKTHEDQIRQVLMQFNNVEGTVFEVQQVFRMLEQAKSVESPYLLHTKKLKATAVYASTNVPLYTLIAHGLIPAFISDEVRFRTPEATRDVYKSLLDIIKKDVDPGVIQRFQLLTESRDVQYDNFRKMHILGMNRNGTQVVRDPAELILFTGSPETGRKVLNQCVEKMNELNHLFGNRTVLFLGFGAGMNPVIVTQDARSNVDQVLDLLLEPVKINCAQDCMVPDFYLVHESVADFLMGKMIRRVREMTPGASNDPNADYSPLSYSTDWGKLAEYRQIHLKQLQNPEATFDPQSKLVAPHIFVFPVSDFKNIELREHYAPFYTIFTYQNEEDLLNVARDPRVQKKAMYASVFGGRSASDWMTRAARIFQENRHAVTINSTLFGSSEGGIPFGGHGSDASMIATLKIQEGQPVEVQMAHAAALVSEEAFFTFGESEIAPKPKMLEPNFYQNHLKELIEKSYRDTQELPELSESWMQFREPVWNPELLSETQVQSVSQENGLFQILMEHAPKSVKEREQLEKFYGTKLVFGNEVYKNKPIPGVLFHPSEVGQAAFSFNAARGVLNPQISHGNLLGLIDDNKLEDYLIAEAIWPGIMAKSEMLGTLLEKKVIGSQFQMNRQRITGLINELMIQKAEPSEEQREQLYLLMHRWLRQFFLDVREHFPEGAYFKNFGDFGTADLGTQITSFSTNPKPVIDQFLLRFEKVLEKPYSRRKYWDLNSTAFQKAMSEDLWEMGTKFLFKLVQNPNLILAQSRVKIARTELGFKKEYRVDVLQGRPIYSKLRFTHEFDPEGCREAQAVVAEFFARAPKEFKSLSAGVDIAKLKNGRWAIIEFNFGTASGTYSPGYFTIESNELISKIQGKDTWLIDQLKNLDQMPLEEQKSYLQKMPIHKQKWWKTSLNDLSAYEVARWLRDQRLLRWSKGEGVGSAEQELTAIRALLSALRSECQEETSRLIEGAAFFLQKSR